MKPREELNKKGWEPLQYCIMKLSLIAKTDTDNQNKIDILTKLISKICSWWNMASLFGKSLSRDLKMYKPGLSNIWCACQLFRGKSHQCYHVLYWVKFAVVWTGMRPCFLIKQ